MATAGTLNKLIIQSSHFFGSIILSLKLFSNVLDDWGLPSAKSAEDAWGVPSMHNPGDPNPPDQTTNEIGDENAFEFGEDVKGQSSDFKCYNCGETRYDCASGYIADISATANLNAPILESSREPARFVMLRVIWQRTALTSLLSYARTAMRMAILQWTAPILVLSTTAMQKMLTLRRPGLSLLALLKSAILKVFAL
jgi:hypothetical protein